MTGHEYPSPDNLRGAPLWPLYVIAQAVDASVGQIPKRAIAVTVEAVGADITLTFHMEEVRLSDIDDIHSIESDFDAALGPNVTITVNTVIGWSVESRQPSSTRAIIFAVRPSEWDDEYEPGQF
ncbi:hypothetical protein GIS00_05810 [Nakamurella sp. YIM 132087]|uniref:Uncharacterized protein n=1 Tax=Nakamurella alba TaxID=2665158 RepID=A0A7K1FHA5_9ACTN|nr:hypothetical protein [Nakamurella alba]MTD13460.1 hypothetical protein [Nakamurella alba]